MEKLVAIVGAIFFAFLVALIPSWLALLSYDHLAPQLGLPEIAVTWWNVISAAIIISVATNRRVSIIENNS